MELKKTNVTKAIRKKNKWELNGIKQKIYKNYKQALINKSMNVLLKQSISDELFYQEEKGEKKDIQDEK